MGVKLDTVSYEERPMQEQKSYPEKETTGMKKCPFCAEQIQAEAIKCRYCGEFLDGTSRFGLKPKGKKWYFTTSAVVIALLCLGPLALPLVWLNPRYKLVTKAIITVVVVILTILLLYLSFYTYQQLINQIRQLGM
jgi:uncharacterized membrane protein YvbJ